MPREQSLPPAVNLRHPLVQQEQRRDAPDEEDDYKQHDQSPRCDTQVGSVVLVEWQPRADVHEARAIQEQIDDGREYLIFCLVVEVPVPTNGGA